MEGPQIQMYATRLRGYVGWTIANLVGERAHAVDSLQGCKIKDAQAFGKLLFVSFKDTDVLLRIHCLMFGDIRFDQIRPGKRLTLDIYVTKRNQSANIRVYLGSTRLTSSSELDPAVMRRDIAGGRQPTLWLMRAVQTERSNTLVCDALLDQNWFPGLGNKIRNEALFMSRLHPELRLSQLTTEELRKLAKSIRTFTRHFESRVTEVNDRPPLDYQIFRKRRCRRCGGSVRNEVLGELQRHCHYCPVCQPRKA